MDLYDKVLIAKQVERNLEGVFCAREAKGDGGKKLALLALVAKSAIQRVYAYSPDHPRSVAGLRRDVSSDIFRRSMVRDLCEFMKNRDFKQTKNQFAEAFAVYYTTLNEAIDMQRIHNIVERS